MAKQIGAIKITGTIDDMTYYKMMGEYYARRKSSLTRKRFFKDKCFEGSRRSSERFGLGYQLASLVYNRIEKEKRVNKLYVFMAKWAIAMLKRGMSKERVVEELSDYLVEFGFLKRVNRVVKQVLQEEVETKVISDREIRFFNEVLLFQRE